MWAVNMHSDFQLICFRKRYSKTIIIKKQTNEAFNFSFKTVMETHSNE